MTRRRVTQSMSAPPCDSVQGGHDSTGGSTCKALTAAVTSEVTDVIRCVVALDSCHSHFQAFVLSYPFTTKCKSLKVLQRCMVSHTVPDIVHITYHRGF